MPDPGQKIKKLIDALDRACRSQGFQDYMPSAMISHFVRQVVPLSMQEDKLDLDQFYKWVRGEYSVPDHVFSRVFSMLKDECADLGVDISLPLDYEPGLNETIQEWLRSELKDVVYGELKEEMRDQVKEDLSKELRPDIHQQIRSGLERAGINLEELDNELLQSMEGTDPSDEKNAKLAFAAAAGQVPSPGPDPAHHASDEQATPRPGPGLDETSLFELRQKVESELREELFCKIEAELKGELSGKVEDDLRTEMWQELQDEVKTELKNVLTPVVEDELRDELREAAAGPEALPQGIFLKVEDHLEVIRKIREQLASRIREQVAEELTQLERKSREEKRKQAMHERLQDREWCLEKIRGFLFPEQPKLWERVKPHVRTDQWRAIVLAQEGEVEGNRERLERARKVIREALTLKADIDEEAGFQSPPGSTEVRAGAIHGMLGEADRMIDFALESIAETLNTELTA